MSDGLATPSITADELLARFIVVSEWIRSNQTVKPSAFIPPKDLELSVTRHKDLSIQEIWDLGEKVAIVRSKTLHGRADVDAEQVRQKRLEIAPQPLPENPNHAVITGWPPDKPAQISLAQELAAVARYLPKPTKP